MAGAEDVAKLNAGPDLKMSVFPRTFQDPPKTSAIESSASCRGIFFKFNESFPFGIESLAPAKLTPCFESHLSTSVEDASTNEHETSFANSGICDSWLEAALRNRFPMIGTSESLAGAC